MPNKVSQVATAGEIHPTPLLGPVDHTVAIRVDISALTAAEVDQHGYLKAGVPLTRTGVLVGVAPAFVFGVVVEPVKVADGNTALAGITADVDVAVATICQVNRAILEDSLGRALTADEIAGFDRAGSKCVLLY